MKEENTLISSTEKHAITSGKRKKNIKYMVKTSNISLDCSNFISLSKYYPNKKVPEQRSQVSEAPHLQRHSTHGGWAPSASTAQWSIRILSGLLHRYISTVPTLATCTEKGLHLPRRVWGVRNNQPTNQKTQADIPLSWRWHSKLDFSSDSLAAVWHREH